MIVYSGVNRQVRSQNEASNVSNELYIWYSDAGSREKYSLYYGKKGEIKMRINVDKKAVLTLVSGVFAIGSAVVGLISKKQETNEAAEKAAKIVMDNLSKENK